MAYAGCHPIRIFAEVNTTRERNVGLLNMHSGELKLRHGALKPTHVGGDLGYLVIARTKLLRSRHFAVPTVAILPVGSNR